MKYIRAYVIRIEYSEKYEIREAKSCRTFIFASRLSSPRPPPYFLFPMKTHIYYKNRLQQRRLHSIFELRRYFSVFHNALSIFFPRPRCIALPENCSILIFRISSFFLFYPYAFSGVSKYLIL